MDGHPLEAGRICHVGYQQLPLYTRTFLEVFGTEPQDCGSVIGGVRKLSEEAASSGIDAAPTPHACYTMSPELVTAASAEGLAAGYLSYHSEESQEEEDLLISGTGALADNYHGRHLSTPPVTGKPSLMYFVDRPDSGSVGLCTRLSEKCLVDSVPAVQYIHTQRSASDPAYEEERAQDYGRY